MGCCHSADSERKPTAFLTFAPGTFKDFDHHDRPPQSAPPSKPVEVIEVLTKGKPLDGSDVRSLESTKKQIIFIRKYARHYLDNLPTNTEEDFVARKVFDEASRAALYKKEDIASFNKRNSVVYKSDEIKNLIIDAIRPNVLFEDNSEEEIVDIVDVFQPVSFKAGDTVIQQGDEGHKFFVVESGELSIHVTVGEGENKSDVMVGSYRRGSAFGELALIFSSPRAATIRATTECKLWCLGRLAYRGVVSQIRFANRAEKMELLRNSRLGRFCDKASLEDLRLALKSDVFSAGDVIVREGENDEAFFLIRSGTVERRCKGENGDVCKLQQKESFGFSSLAKGDTNDATYVALTAVSVYYLTKSGLERMAGSIDNVLGRKLKSRSLIREEIMSRLADTTNFELGLDQLNYFNVIGKGAFAEVTLVQSQESGEVYALKGMVKHGIVEKGHQERLLNELRIVRGLDHPNIAKIHCAMQDTRKVYFLMDLLPGGELLNYLIKRTKFSEDEARFYAASVILALDQTTSLMIAHRDIKPENLVLNRKGFCILVDFAIAKEVNDGQTFTFCGTPDYLAPEIICGTGHDWGVDYWALGILLFELTCGTAPFYSSNISTRTRKILKGYGVVHPPVAIGSGLSDLISELLVADQSKRLGRTLNGIQGIKNHRWFAGFDWDGLLEQSISVPIEPDTQSDIMTLGRRDVFSRNNRNLEDIPESDWWPELLNFEQKEQ